MDVGFLILILCMIDFLLSSYFFRISWALGNDLYFLTTSIKPFGSSVNDGKRIRKVRNQKVQSHKFWVLEDADRRLSKWEKTTSASFGRETRQCEGSRMGSA